MKRRLVMLMLVLFIFSFMNIQRSTAEASDRGRLYVIGTGPAGPQMATLQAIDTIKRMDTIVASKEHVELFADYVGNKPVLFDPWTGVFDYKGKSIHRLDRKEMITFMKERLRIRTERVEQIKGILAQGKNVGLLDSGNPCLFAPSHWYVEQFAPEDVVIIPGMGSDAAAMAALGKSVIPAHNTRFVIQTSPSLLIGRRTQDMQLLEDLSKYSTTMIQYMALQMPERLFAALGKVYPPDMPCAVVYWAGYPDRQHIVRGTVADMAEKLSKEKEEYMGLLLIGRFLEGKPYEASMPQPMLTKRIN